MKTEKLKSEGKYFEAGRNARENNEPRAYGCHFGMRSSRDYAMTEFYKGYDANPEKEQEPMEPRQIENVQDLLSVKACETFLWNKQIYCALEDATKHGVCGAYIRSNLFNGAGWICGDVLEVFTQEPAKEEEPALHPDFDLPEEPRIACVYLANFGTQSDKEAICATITRLTPYRAYVNETGVPVIPCRIYEIGDLFAYLSQHNETNWIEYSVHFG